MARVLHLPDRGRLLVATDLQGNLRDFLRIQEIFEASHRANAGLAHLLFTGDLIHGPHLAPEEWPDFLGAFYRDESPQVMDAFVALQQRFPGHVHAILGNHEHGHIGGPHTAKFAADEVVVLEAKLGRRFNLADRGESLDYVAAGGPEACGGIITSAVEIAAQIIDGTVGRRWAKEG